MWRSTGSIFKAGVAHVPEDRLEDGCVPGFTIVDNLVLNTYYRAPFSRGIRLDREAIQRSAHPRARCGLGRVPPSSHRREARRGCRHPDRLDGARRGARTGGSDRRHVPGSDRRYRRAGAGDATVARDADGGLAAPRERGSSKRVARGAWGPRHGTDEQPVAPVIEAALPPGAGSAGEPPPPAAAAPPSRLATAVR